MPKDFKPYDDLSKRQQARRLKQEMIRALMCSESSQVSWPKEKEAKIIRITPNTIKRNIRKSDDSMIHKYVIKRPVTKVNQASSDASTSWKPNDLEEDTSEGDQFEEVSSDEVFLSSNEQEGKELMDRRKTDVNTPVDSLFFAESLNPQEHSDSCCNNCREKLDIIYNQQCEILYYLRTGLFTTRNFSPSDLLPTMPFDNANDLLTFDESLAHENVQDQFVIKIRKLLSTNELKSVSNIMSSVLTNALCKSVSWVGVRDTIAFGSTSMVRYIVDNIQEHHVLDIDVVKGRIADWLRRYSDRLNLESKKKSKIAKRESDVFI